MSGRKARYNVRIAKRICEHIALGATLKRALEKEPLAPTVPLFWRWLDEYPEFRDMYERARLLQADLMSDTIMEMAENVLQHPKFAPAYKVAADILRWQAEIKNPARYGSKVTIEHKKTLDPTTLRKEIKQLEKELGFIGHEPGEPAPRRALQNVVDVEAREVKDKEA